jgi:hypothetical protein
MATIILRQFRDYLPVMRKALVAGFVTAGLALLALVGVDGDMSVNDALAALAAFVVNTFLTWVIPNRSEE